VMCERGFITAVDATLRQWASNSVANLAAPGGPDSWAHGEKFGVLKGLDGKPVGNNDDGRNYADPSEPKWRSVAAATGQSVLSELKKQGALIAESTAKRLLKLAVAKVRLQMRTGALVAGKKRTYRTWQAAQIADRLTKDAEEFGLKLLDAAEKLPDKRRVRRYQRVSTTRASRTMPTWDRGSFQFGGRAALRLRRGRPPLPAEEWKRRYRARRKVLRTRVTVPETKWGRPSSPLSPAGPST